MSYTELWDYELTHEWETVFNQPVFHEIVVFFYGSHGGSSMLPVLREQVHQFVSQEVAKSFFPFRLSETHFASRSLNTGFWAVSAFHRFSRNKHFLLFFAF